MNDMRHNSRQQQSFWTKKGTKMKATNSAPSETQRELLHGLFEEKSPVLVEVRFPRMGTSPDWHLCEAEADFDSIWETLGPGAEVHLHSVWDIKNVARPTKLTR